MKQKQCTNLQKPSSFWRSLRLFFSALILLPLALTIILIKQILRFITLCIRRPMIKEPIHFIRSEAVKDIDDWNEEEKKTQELINFDSPEILENARFELEILYHVLNEQNNEQNNLKKFPEVDYDDSIH
jgi:hypothetical protein